MMNSMTAFAQAKKMENKFTVITEIRTYNSKNLDIVIRIPHDYFSFEDKIKNLISKRIIRGRVEVKLRIIDESEDVRKVEINESKAAGYYEALVRLKDRFDIDTKIPLSLLAGAEGVLTYAEIERDMASYQVVISGCVFEALDDLCAMRKREGEFLSLDIAKRLDYIEKNINKIETESRDLLTEYQDRLKERIKVLTKGLVDIDPGRIAQEAAFLADRSDISEEIVRAASHLKQFRSIMDSPEPAGRKLNFLLQEFIREFNTMGSKTGKSDISYVIVDVKTELEKIREQVQNVE